MNIAFLLLTLNRGGIENLTCFLANELQKKGHMVTIIVIKPEKNVDLVKTLDSSIKVIFLGEFSANKHNVKSVRELLLRQHIQIVVNQFGLPYIPCLIIKRACRGLNVKLISVYHTDPIANGRILTVEQQLRNEENYIKRVFYKAKRCVYYEITRRSMRYVYKNSDAYVLLSPCFRNNFIKFTRIKKPEKLSFIANPVTIDPAGFEYVMEKKKKQILFVGRIDNPVKRIDRVLDIWAQLEIYHPCWELIILGDGPDLPFLKQYCKDKDIERVSFLGSQYPVPFYKDASIILLTSEFEGFGLVLVEGMTFGVVPVGYGSYDSIYDIVEDGENGYVVKPQKDGFPYSLMSEKVKALMQDAELRNKMAQKALNIGNKFNKDEIIKKWESLFSKLL